MPVHRTSDHVRSHRPGSQDTQRILLHPQWSLTAGNPTRTREPGEPTRVAGRSRSDPVRPSRRDPRVLLWGVPTAVLTVVAGILGTTGDWQRVGVSPSVPAYLDLAQITYSAGCTLPGAGQVGDTTCDPVGRPYNYPPIWAAAARLLGVDAHDTVWLGGLLAAVGLAALALFQVRFAGRPTAGRIAVLTAVTCSPPMLLLIARGNIDLVMLALLVAGAGLVVSGRNSWAAAVIACAAGLKLFPVGGLLSLRRRPAVIGGLLSAVAILVLDGRWLGAIRAATPSAVTDSFGVGVLPSVARHVDSSSVASLDLGSIPSRLPVLPVLPVDQAAGLTLFATLYAGLLLTRTGRRAVGAATASLRRDHVSTTAFLVGAGPFLVSYLLTNSFDYRLAPLLFVAVACLRTDVRALHGLTAGLVVVFWAEVTATPAQLVGDVALCAVAPCIAAVATLLVLERWGLRPGSAFLGRLQWGLGAGTGVRPAEHLANDEAPPVPAGSHSVDRGHQVARLHAPSPPPPARRWPTHP